MADYSSAPTEYFRDFDFEYLCREERNKKKIEDCPVKLEWEMEITFADAGFPRHLS
jgi:hypothetical protein